jgi:polyhydroxyalkanoate synthase
MPGRELAFVFSTLRGNDLIWPYVVGNYLEGRQPDTFDILYWNADSTNLPGPMYCWYVGNTYLENNLRIPGKTIQCDIPINLGDIDVPTYVLASREDHIVPWQTAYRTTRLIKARFASRWPQADTLQGGSTLLPATSEATGSTAASAQSPTSGSFAGAHELPGNWWTDWSAWLKGEAGNAVPARARS